jgi:hypothetical protein
MRPARMDDGQLMCVEESLQRREARMHPEEAVEIVRGVSTGSRPRDRDARPRGVIRFVAERDDHVESVDGAPLKHRDEHAASRRRRGHRAREELRREAEADERQSAVLQEHSSGDHGRLPFLEFR